MTIRAVFLDVGETLVDERRYWEKIAALAGVEPHALWAALGVTIDRGEEHWDLYRHLGLVRPDAADGVVYESGDLYPDAAPALAALRAAGYLVGVAGNQSEELEAWLRSQQLPVDVVGSSAGWGVRKPSPAFFERVAAEAGRAPGEVAYVGDRIDNDVVPAAEAGLVAIHLRRGPWGRLQRPDSRAAAVVDSLLELPALLAGLDG